MRTASSFALQGRFASLASPRDLQAPRVIIPSKLTHSSYEICNDRRSLSPYNLLLPHQYPRPNPRSLCCTR